MKFTLKQLNYFVLAAESKSVTKAAHAANISQPSISAAIAELETAFNTKLFARHHARGLSLTTIGHQFLSEAKLLIAQSERFQRAVSEGLQGFNGTIEIGCLLTLAPLFVPPLMRAIKKTHPKLTIKCRELDIKEIIEELRNGSYEIAITYDLFVADDVVFRGIQTFAPYVIVPHRHPLAKREKVSLKSLAADPMILLDLPYTRDYFKSIFDAAGVTPNIVYRTSSPQMVRSMVANGMGYSILNARPHLAQTFEDQQLVIKNLSGRLPKLRMGIVYLANHVFTKAARTLLEEFELQNKPDKSAARS